jgi:ABC-type multidrug transport system fused ATPase/permease subunit
MTHVLNWVVRMYSLFATDLGSLERVVNFTNQQEATETANCPDNWPTHGSIQFRDVELKYQPDADAVLRGVSFDVKPKEKIGIVGRTGAGKSSLMLALFRLVEPSRGSVVIDGVDISTLGLHDLRSQLTMIPQDPILFEGTIRSNLDPFERYFGGISGVIWCRHSDEEVIRALKSVGLFSTIEKLPESIRTSTTECKKFQKFAHSYFFRRT